MPHHFAEPFVLTMDLSDSSSSSSSPGEEDTDFGMRTKRSAARAAARRSVADSPPSSQGDWSFSSQPDNAQQRIPRRSIILAGASLGVPLSSQSVSQVRRPSKPSFAPLSLSRTSNGSSSTSQNTSKKKRRRQTSRQSTIHPQEKHSTSRPAPARQTKKNITKNHHSGAMNHSGSNPPRQHRRVNTTYHSTNDNGNDDASSTSSNSDTEVPYSQNFDLSHGGMPTVSAAKLRERGLRKQLQALEEHDEDSDHQGQERNKAREPLRPGDVIAYYSPFFTHGDARGYRITQVLATTAPQASGTDDSTCLVDLANGEFLPQSTVVRRVGEYRHNVLLPHAGVGRTLRAFRLRTRRLSDSTTSGLQRKVDALRKTIAQTRDDLERLPSDDEMAASSATPTPSAPGTDDDDANQDLYVPKNKELTKSASCRSRVQPLTSKLKRGCAIPRAAAVVSLPTKRGKAEDNVMIDTSSEDEIKDLEFSEKPMVATRKANCPDKSQSAISQPRRLWKNAFSDDSEVQELPKPENVPKQEGVSLVTDKQTPNDSIFPLTRSLHEPPHRPAPAVPRTNASPNQGDDMEKDDNDTSSDEDLLAAPIFRNVHRSPSSAKSSGTSPRLANINLKKSPAVAANPASSSHYRANEPSRVQDAIKQGLDDWTAKMERQHHLQHFSVRASGDDGQDSSSSDMELRKSKTRRTNQNKRGRKTNQSVGILLCSAFLFLTVVSSFTLRSSFHHVNDLSPVHTRHGGVKASSTSVATMGTQNNQSVWDELLSRFQGDFDNYSQVVEDRNEGLVPREGGGHEHIHCCLLPVSTSSRLAAFYFDADPTAIFRFRFYRLVPDQDSNMVDTVLYTLDPSLELSLRNCTTPLEWKQLFEKENGFERVTELKDCDVRWSWTLDAVQHSYAASHIKDHDGIHAIMVHGEALVESQQMPGVQILIRDQLSLWKDELWIHDRGFDPKTMTFIYGNQREVPYRLERVSTIHHQDSCTSGDGDLVRDVSNNDLEWTLGPSYRTVEEYGTKLEAVGGPSRPQRKG